MTGRATTGRRQTLSLQWRRTGGAQETTWVDDYVEVREECMESPVQSPQACELALIDETRPTSTTRKPSIFATAGQAIHVAFVVLANEAQQDCLFRKALVRILEAIAMPTDAQSEWLEQLRGSPSKTVRFEGLSPYDIRAQCALIMSAVRTRLPEVEMWALQAKYGKTESEGPVKNRRWAFSREKADAIRNLANWLAASRNFDQLSLQALTLMVARLYVTHKRTEISFRDLAQQFGGNRMTYQRAFHSVRAMLGPLVDMAIGRLTPYFQEQGLVDAEE